MIMHLLDNCNLRLGNKASLPSQMLGDEATDAGTTLRFRTQEGGRLHGRDCRIVSAGYDGQRRPR